MKRQLNQREKVLLFVLVAAGGGLLYWKQGSVDFSGGGSGKQGKHQEFGEPPQVLLELLAQDATSFDAGGRNLFDYYTPPPPIAPEPIHRPVPPPPPVEVAQVTEPPRPVPPPKPQAPQPRFQYLGSLGPKDAKLAVFETSNEGVTIKRIGDTVEKDFRLVAFKHDAVVLGYSDKRWKDQTTELKMMGLRGAS